MIRFPITKARSFSKCQSGMTALEFALLSPLLILVLAGIVDIGSAIGSRYSMNSTLTAGVHYVLANGAQVDSKTGTELAAKTLVMLAGGLDRASGIARASINGETAATYESGAVTRGKSSAKFDKCFCPTVANKNVNWGAASTCGSPCASGGYSGKFVEFSMSQRTEPLFKGVLDLDGSIYVQSMVQVQ